MASREGQGAWRLPPFQAYCYSLSNCILVGSTRHDCSWWEMWPQHFFAVVSGSLDGGRPLAERDDHDLEKAYAIKTPTDAIHLYSGWATTYDQSFAEAWGYIAPREIANCFKAAATLSEQPILDIGAGTGLLASELSDWTIDGIDVSAPMLEIAASKGLYRKRIVADVTKPLDIAGGTYRGFISSGTFTHGHVGPVCLHELLRIARPNALFCLGTNPGVFDQAGFGSAFALLVAADQITTITFKTIPIYEGADHSHAKDQGLVAIFRKRDPNPSPQAVPL